MVYKSDISSLFQTHCQTFIHLLSCYATQILGLQDAIFRNELYILLFSCNFSEFSRT